MAVEMEYVQRQVSKGKEYLYLRKEGLPRVRLESPWPALGEDPTKSALGLEVARLIAELTPQQALPGTLKAAIRVYQNESPDFLNLAASTQYEYGLILKELEEDFGGLAIAEFKAAYILQLRNVWAGRGHRAANIRLQILKNVLWPSCVAGLIEGGDPFAMIPGVRRPHDAPEPHRLWSGSVFNTIINAAIDEERFGIARAVAIGRYAGPRRGDIVRLTAAARHEGRFRYLAGKRKVPVDIEEDPELTYWLGEIPARQPNTPRAGRKVPARTTSLRSLTLVFSVTGAPYTEDGLALELGKLVDRLVEAGRLDSANYNLHGLRHTRGVELALAGATDAEIAAHLGHASASSAATYRRQADRIRLADNAADKLRDLRNARGTGAVKRRVK